MDRQEETAYTFENVQIFKKEELGHGSYGAVYKAKCDALPCAAKLIYPLLFGSNTSLQPGPPQGKEHRQPMRRFEAECRFLSQIKHPNIVQYLGMYRDSETNAPVLLMELMDESLTHFLETAQNPILFHIQVNILHDTALALAFLHTNGITHRDLSSNNVLLIAGSRAKVTDFGMSKLTDVTTPHLASMTQCPGTPAYMPPEALKKPPKYSNKLDCFSYGVLTIQVITQEFPDPKDQYQNRELCDPNNPSQRFQALVCVPELERRQSHISLISEAHHLRPIALDCLKDRDVERPKAQQLCERLELLKTTPLYASSICQITDRDRLLQTQRETIQDKEEQLQDLQQTIQNQQQIIQDEQQTIQDKQQIIQDQQQTIQDKQQIIQDQQQQLQIAEQENLQLKQELHTYTKENQQLQTQNELIQPNQQLKRENQQLREQCQSASEDLVLQGITENDRKIKQLQSQLQQVELKLAIEQQQKQVTIDSEVRKNTPQKELKLSWKGVKEASTTMRRGSITTIGRTTYVNHFSGKNVYAFHYDTMWWSTLPQCPYEDCTLTSINNKLTAVGGEISFGQCTNKLISYSDHKWVELYPPMPTERCWAAVLSTITYVVVIGGVNQGDRLTTVEILNIEAKQWSTASHLPYAISRATTTLCGEFVYLLGGDTSTYSNAYTALCCRLGLEDLVKQSTPSMKGEHSLRATTRSTMWHKISDLPVMYSTCVTVQGHVLAIGGIDKQFKSSSIIYRYDQQKNQWTVLTTNNMTIAKSHCLATALPDNNLLVVGGVNDNGNETNETEIATIV